jgi:2-amino-4-hydroxy-6-hydroxymethyldihydropteridine diphosphokinase
VKQPEHEFAIAYLGLGSNLGDRLLSIREAILALHAHPEINIDLKGGVAPLYETSPVGVTEAQTDFLNTALRIQTTLSPTALLHAALTIEAAFGRTRLRPGSARAIDIDLLLFDDLVIQSHELTIPHPRLQERQFVLRPLCDLAPGLVHPILGRTIRELLESERGSGVKGLVERFPAPASADWIDHRVDGSTSTPPVNALDSVRQTC